MISYVIPTRDRPDTLRATLEALGGLPAHVAEVVVVDNASAAPVREGRTLANGLGVKIVRLERNAGAAARNAGVAAADATSEWIVMLDDDSRPLSAGFVQGLREQARDVAAVQAEVWLGESAERTGGRRHEAGGLPEVFVGCGVAIRRAAFVQAGGYDASFDYYAEEYDLAAKMLRLGGRVVMDRRFEVVHEKIGAGRNMDRILRRLVRNNAWVMQRYAPESVRREEIARTIARYGRIAVRERASVGYARGVLEMSATLFRQERAPLARDLWERFTGKAAAMRSLQRAWGRRGFKSAVVVAPGKNTHLVHECLAELGVREVAEEREAEAVVIGTLSPGPALDVCELLAGEARLVAPWPVAEGEMPGTVRVRAVTQTLAAA